MEEEQPCPYCENFEGSCFTAQGKVQAFRFCPICGRPYSRNAAYPQAQGGEKGNSEDD